MAQLRAFDIRSHQDTWTAGQQKLLKDRRTDEVGGELQVARVECAGPRHLRHREWLPLIARLRVPVCRAVDDVTHVVDAVQVLDLNFGHRVCQVNRSRLSWCKKIANVLL